MGLELGRLKFFQLEFKMKFEYFKFDLQSTSEEIHRPTAANAALEAGYRHIIDTACVQLPKRRCNWKSFAGMDSIWKN